MKIEDVKLCDVSWKKNYQINLNYQMRLHSWKYKIIKSINK